MKKEMHIQREVDNYICGKRKVKNILQTAIVFKFGEANLWGEAISHITIFQWYASKSLTIGFLKRKKEKP